jgi:glycine oxidase
MHPDAGFRLAMPDVVVAGGGIIGLCAATAAARRGLHVTVIGEHRPGEASAAAAGMLAPSVEKSEGPAHRFACSARDLFPSFLEELAAATGITVPLNRLGVLQVALSEKGVRGLRRTAGPNAEWIAQPELAVLEPALAHALGAVLNPDDGAVDNVRLMAALAELALRDARVEQRNGAVKEIRSTSSSVSLMLETGERVSAGFGVICPGAWAGEIRGAPLLSAVRPSRGQLVAYTGGSVRHVTYGPRGYLVPREGGTIAGTTMEDVGFDSSTTPEGIAKIQAAAEEIAPALAGSPVTASWAGLRPVTPDMLPILGPDPETDRIVYACGHSRNGILLAPLTGEIVAALVTEEPLLHDISQFHPARFSG